MKLAFSAWAMREAPVETQIELVRRAGYVGICLVSGAEFSLDAVSADAAERHRIRRLLDDAQLSLTAVAGRTSARRSTCLRRSPGSCGPWTHLTSASTSTTATSR